ncbi:ribosome maturation factor RimP [Actinomyces mediterranea]|uniref:ribosome maturation factor RimP n=1 Tax=Actinomyces mediterranea TaxID=1871028 RepID=UPI00097056D1|nr:ribosome maturation factor RimP [Actinomyces mediterranea]
MSQSQRLSDLEELLRSTVQGFELELDSVVRANQSGTPVIRVTVDAPIGIDGIDSDALADVSRAVSKILDDVDPEEGEYLLEVSTPGAERELTEPRHWLKQVGRLTSVKLRDKTALVGRVESATDEQVTLIVDGEATTIDYTQMKKARACVEFGMEE